MKRFNFTPTALSLLSVMPASEIVYRLEAGISPLNALKDPNCLPVRLSDNKITPNTTDLLADLSNQVFEWDENKKANKNYLQTNALMEILLECSNLSAAQINSLLSLCQAASNTRSLRDYFYAIDVQPKMLSLSSALLCTPSSDKKSLFTSVLSNQNYPIRPSESSCAQIFNLCFSQEPMFTPPHESLKVFFNSNPQEFLSCDLLAIFAALRQSEQKSDNEKLAIAKCLYEFLTILLPNTSSSTLGRQKGQSDHIYLFKSCVGNHFALGVCALVLYPKLDEKSQQHLLTLLPLSAPKDQSLNSYKDMYLLTNANFGSTNLTEGQKKTFKV